MDECVLKIEKLEKSFGALQVLKGIDLEIRKGEVVCIIGASGSGKSTLLRCINLLEEADSGSIWFDGQDLMDLSVNLNALRQKIGMVFQSFNLFNNKNVLDNCTTAPMTVKRIPRAKAEETAIRNLTTVGLADFIYADSTRLSGGQKQRVAIAGIVAMRPECIILDEPTAMLDPQGRREVIRAVRALNDVENITVILITHYMEEVIYANKVFVMDQGRIVMDGTPREVFSHVGELEQMRLTVPPATRLAYELKKKGVRMPDGILSAEEFAEALCRLL